MQPVLRTAVTLLLTTTTTLLPAQGSGYSTGSIELSPRVSTSYLSASLREASRETRWLQFVVLWRGQSGWSGGRRGLDTATLRRAQAEYNTARKAALARDGLFVGGQSGGVAYTAEADSARRTLTVLGQRFSIPRGDSALIVMVDRIDGVGGDPIVAATRVVESRLPDVPAERTWTSGDTTFIVRPRGREPGSDRLNIEAMLGRDSTVAAFLRVGALGGPTDVLVPISPRTVTFASPAEFQPDLAAVDGPFECSGPEAIGQSAMGRLLVGADAIAYTAAFPSKSDTKATVVVMVDPAGGIIRYSERRGPPLRPPQILATATRGIARTRWQPRRLPSDPRTFRWTIAPAARPLPTRAADGPMNGCQARSTSWGRWKNSASPSIVRNAFSRSAREDLRADLEGNHGHGGAPRHVELTLLGVD
jgi:hypothetical protein